MEAGILETRAASDGSAYQEYVLTAKGESLFPVMVALRQWSEQHLFVRGERHSVLIDKRTSKPISHMAPRAKDGSVLRPEATKVRQVT